MFATMADVPSFATKVSMMGSKKQQAQPLKRPTSTDLKQHLNSSARVFGRESAKANTMAGMMTTTSSSSTSTSPEIKGLMLPPPPPAQGRKDPFGELAMVPVLASSSRTTAPMKKARPNSQGSSRRSSANSGYMLFRPSPTRIEVSSTFLVLRKQAATDIHCVYSQHPLYTPRLDHQPLDLPSSGIANQTWPMLCSSIRRCVRETTRKSCPRLRPLQILRRKPTPMISATCSVIPHRRLRAGMPH